MNRFVSAEVVFKEKLTPAVSFSFQKAKMGEIQRGSLPPNSVFWNLGESGGGPSLIETVANFDFRISGFMSLLNLTL